MEVLAVQLPFLHVLLAQVLSASEEARLLSRLDELDWNDWSGEFFRIHVSANSDQLTSFKALPELRVMISKLRPVLELHLGKSITDEASLSVQRYKENATIGFHTDEVAADIRFVLNLNRSWSLSDGGVWVFSSEPTLRNARFLPPLSNTGFGFVPDPNTFHALSRRSSSVSYAVVMSYPCLQA
jgi:hypothetical protein